MSTGFRLTRFGRFPSFIGQFPDGRLAVNHTLGHWSRPIVGIDEILGGAARDETDSCGFDFLGYRSLGWQVSAKLAPNKPVADVGEFTLALGWAMHPFSGSFFGKYFWQSTLRSKVHRGASPAASAQLSVSSRPGAKRGDQPDPPA